MSDPIMEYINAARSVELIEGACEHAAMAAQDAETHRDQAAESGGDAYDAVREWAYAAAVADKARAALDAAIERREQAERAVLALGKAAL